MCESVLDKPHKTDRNGCATKNGVLNFGWLPPNCRGTPPPMLHKVEVSGYDENGKLLTATLAEGFRFKAVASGPIAFQEGSPLTAASSGAGTKTTLRVSNFPDDITAADVEVTIGAHVITAFASFSISEDFLAKITFVIPDSGCSSICPVAGFVAIPVRNLKTDPGFTFTYVANTPPVINSFYPVYGSIEGGQPIQFQIANLAADPTTKNYLYPLSSLTFTFGNLPAVSATAVDPSSSDGVVVVTALSSAAVSGALQVMLNVDDEQFNQVTYIAQHQFLYFDDSYIEAVSPQSAPAGTETDFDLHVGNHVHDSSAAYTVSLCGESLTASSVPKTSISSKISFASAGCIGSQTFTVSNDMDSTTVTGVVEFSQPVVQISPATVAVSGYTVTMSVFGLPQATAPNDILLQHGTSPVQTLSPSAVLSSIAGKWTVFTVAMPAASATGTVTGTVGYSTTSNSSGQAYSIVYTADPSAHNVVPQAGYTSEATQVSFVLNDFHVSDRASDLECSIGVTALDVISVSVISYEDRKMAASIVMPRSTSPNTVVVRCTHRQHLEAGSAAFGFTYELPSPAVSLDVSRGSHSGGTAITVDILNFYIMPSADFSVTFSSSSGRSVVANSTLVFSEPASNTSASMSRLTMSTPAADGPAEVEMTVTSGTKSASHTFLYIDTAVYVTSVCTDVCTTTSSTVAAVGSVPVNITIANFPYTILSDVVATYVSATSRGSKSAAVLKLERLPGMASETVLNLLFDSQVDAGDYVVTISPSSQSSIKVYVDIHFEASIQPLYARFSTYMAGAVEIKFNMQIGYINQLPVSNLFSCSSAVANAIALFGTDLCVLNSARDSIVASVSHERDATVVSGTAITVRAGMIQPPSKLSTAGAQTLTLQNPPNLEAPVGAIYGPQQIDLCTSSVALSGSQSSGAGYLTFYWSSTSSNELQAFLQAQPVDAADIVLQSEYLPPSGETYSICLQVTDILVKTSQSICHSIARGFLPVPTVQLVGTGTQVVLSSDRQNILEGSAAFSDCIGRHSTRA